MGALTRKHIAEQIHWLHGEIWKNQDTLWPNKNLSRIQMLEPQAAAQVLGVEYQEFPSLGPTRFGYRGERFKPAGLIDRQAGKIAVSTDSPIPVMRFTAAHEIGHWLLHPNQVMHRDLPLDGSSILKNDRPPEEKEADYAAACFLIPRRLLEEIFRQRFKVRDQFVFDDTTCFHLAPSDHESLLRSEKDSLDRAIALARCTRFNGDHFHSLANLFRVSDKAMAIRIQQLDLIRWP